MHIEIKSGHANPIADGRYLCFVSHDLERGTALPVILIWHDGAWHLPYNMIAHRAPVYGYAGPLPVGRCAQLFPDAVSENAFAPRGIKPSNWNNRQDNEEFPPLDHSPSPIRLEYDL